MPKAATHNCLWTHPIPGQSLPLASQQPFNRTLGFASHAIHLEDDWIRRKLGFMWHETASHPGRKAPAK